MLVARHNHGSLKVAETLDVLISRGVLSHVHDLVVQARSVQSPVGGVTLHATRLAVNGDADLVPFSSALSMTWFARLRVAAMPAPPTGNGL